MRANASNTPSSSALHRLWYLPRPSIAAHMGAAAARAFDRSMADPDAPLCGIASTPGREHHEAQASATNPLARTRQPGQETSRGSGICYQPTNTHTPTPKYRPSRKSSICYQPLTRTHQHHSTEHHEDQTSATNPLTTYTPTPQYRPSRKSSICYQPPKHVHTNTTVQNTTKLRHLLPTA